MKRTTALWAVLALVAAGCQASHAAAGTPRCGLGMPLPGGEITYVRGGRLIGAALDGSGQRCIGTLTGRNAAISWAPLSDRALVGTTALLPGRTSPSGFAATDRLTWSPAGRSILAVTAAGALLREPAGVDQPRDITFLNRHETAIYHPSGRAIVSVGEGNEGYGMYLADTDGKLLASLVEGETARHIGPLAWTGNGDLVFAARHADRWDLHRLQLGGAGQLTTLASTPGPDQPITDIVASPFPAGGIAWRQGDCANGTLTTQLIQGNQRLSPPAEAATARPIGWLPDGSLVLATTGNPCPKASQRGAAGTVYVFKDRRATRVMSAPGNGTVRVALPPGPDLPSPIASAGPI